MEQIIQLNSNAKLSEHLASPSEAALGHSNKLDGSHLSPNFTLGEFTRSSSHPEVYNIPSHEAIANLTNLCKWLEILRERAGVPIIINSGYRSPQLNKKIGGVPTSNHLTGCAVDIRVSGMEQLIRYAAILLDYADETHQEFDELLIEKNRHGAIWLHFAVRPSGNRHKVLFINA
jgi:hypothetical protein